MIYMQIAQYPITRTCWYYQKSKIINNVYTPVEHFHSHAQHLCKFTQTKGSIYVRKEVNYQRTTLEHQQGRHFIVLEHQCGHCDLMWKCSMYSRTPVTQTLKGNKKQFKLAGNSSYRGKFQWNFDQGKGNFVQVSREFKLSEFEPSRFM